MWKLMRKNLRSQGGGRGYERDYGLVDCWRAHGGFMLAFSCSASENSVHLSEEEIVLYPGSPCDSPGDRSGVCPFEFLNENDQYTGITADYLDSIRERTGLQFEVVPGLTCPKLTIWLWLEKSMFYHLWEEQTKGRNTSSFPNRTTTSRGRS